MQLAVALLLALPTAADEIHVPDEYASVQAAIDAAQAGDTVLVAPGTYFEAIDFLGKPIRVVGEAGAQNTVLDAMGTSKPVATFHGGEDGHSRLQGFTLRHGSTTGRGGGISCYDPGATPASSSPTIADCIVRDCDSLLGGGGVAGSPTLVRCSIVGNASLGGDGGGVWGSPRLEDCVVAFNSAVAAAGGGLYVSSGSVLVESTLILDNVSTDTARGGGVTVDGSASVLFQDCLIARNFADGESFLASCDPPLEDVIPGVYTGRGGALYAEPGSLVRLERCTVAGNRATSQFSGCGSVPLGTGGLHGAFEMEDSILWGNVPAEDHASSVAITHSLVEGGAAGIGILDVDPQFADPLASDWTLLASSPAIDAGTPGSSDPDGSLADLGAFPFQTLYVLPNTTTESWDDPAWSTISASVGGKLRLGLRLGSEHVGSTYVVLGSLSGTSPGFALLGLPLPLAFDAYTLLTLTHANQAPLENSFGLLDDQGSGSMALVLPGPLPPSYPGLTLHHAAFVWDPEPVPSASAVTKAVAVSIVP